MDTTWSINTKDWAIAEEGVYVENSEFVYVKKDAEGKILWAIKTDGTIYYGAGVPPQIVEYITEKIAELSLDEYEEIVAFLGELIEGDETLQSLLDKKVDGEYINNPEFVKVVTDKDGKILWAIKTDGSIYWTVGIPQHVKDYIQEKIDEADELTDEQVAYIEGMMDSYYLKDFPTYLNVTIDSENRVLEGITKDGEKEVNIPIKLQSATIGSYRDLKGRLSIVVDSNNRIIGYRDKDGKLYEALPTNQDDILREDIGKINSSVENIYDGTGSNFEKVYPGTVSSFALGELVNILNPQRDIPERSHVRPQAEEAKARIDAFIDNDSIVFPIVTDVHDMMSNEKIKVARDIFNSAKYINYDFISQLGDIKFDGENTQYAVMNKIYNWACMFATVDIPVLSVKGNHDVLCEYDGGTYGYKHEGVFLDDLTYANYLQTPQIRKYSNMHWATDKGYLYYDIPNKNVRVIMLNSSEDNIGDNKNTFYYYTIEQIQWVINVLSNTPNNYDVILMAHRIPGRGDLIARIPPNGTILAKIFEDFNSHSSGSNTENELNWDFTNKTNTIIAAFGGDAHVDASSTENGVNYIISQGQGSTTLNENKQNITFTRVDYNTVMFCDVVCIKPSERKIKVIKMGWNDDSLDRSFTY